MRTTNAKIEVLLGLETLEPVASLSWSAEPISSTVPSFFTRYNSTGCRRRFTAQSSSSPREGHGHGHLSLSSGPRLLPFETHTVTSHPVPASFHDSSSASRLIHNDLSVTAARCPQSFGLSLKRPYCLAVQEEQSHKERLSREPPARSPDGALVHPHPCGHPLPDLLILLPQGPREALPGLYLFVQSVGFVDGHRPTYAAEI